jgi:dTDP-4-amino-4,6-dideoxy-D-galactose acyltransferase
VSTVAGRPVVHLLEWDTSFFGRRIASIAGAGIDAASLGEALTDAREQGVECLYALSPVDDMEAVRALSTAGGRLVDVRMTFERSLEAGQPVPDLRSARESRSARDTLVLRPSKPADVPALRALAAKSHGSSRFYADGRFPDQRCDELFATWIEKSCSGWADLVLVADVDGEPRGYVTGHVRESNRAEIGLVAVDPQAQGHGAGSRLVEAAVDAFRARGVTQVTVVTQGRNLPAQRLYQSRGFRTQRLQVWHHVWLDEIVERR